MKLFILVGLAISLLLSCERSISDDWEMVWSDEFNQDGIPDNSKWTFTSQGTSDWNRYCVADTATVVVRKGRLLLKGKHDPVLGKYKTGGIQSKGKFSFKYGKVEVCARLGKGKGSWPAIWMMPEKSVYGGWPKSGEIDIMEHLNFDSYVYQTLHSDYIDVRKIKNDPKYYSTSSFHVGDFNVYGLEWYPDRLEFFINEMKTFTYPKVEGEGFSQWPFDQEFYLILNQALGGNWVGAIVDSDLPVQMEVDWVRVFQKSK